MLLLITTNYLSHLHLVLLLLSLDRRRCRLVHLESAMGVLHCQSPAMSTAAIRAVIDGLLRTMTRGLTLG